MVGLVGVEARVQVRARAGREVTSAIQEMFKSVKPCSRDVQERQAMFEGCSREASHVRGMFKRGKPCSRDVQESYAMFKKTVLQLARCLKQSNLALPAGGLSNPIVHMGRSPAHVQACWGGPKVL